MSQPEKPIRFQYNVLFERGTLVNNTAFTEESDKMAMATAQYQAKRFGAKSWVLERYTGVPGQWQEVVTWPLSLERWPMDDTEYSRCYVTAEAGSIYHINKP